MLSARELSTWNAVRWLWVDSMGEGASARRSSVVLPCVAAECRPRGADTAAVLPEDSGKDPSPGLLE